MSIIITVPKTYVHTSSDLQALPVGAKIKVKGDWYATRTKDGYTILGSEFTVNHIATQYVPASPGAEYVNAPLPIGTRVEVTDERWSTSPGRNSKFVGKVGKITKNNWTTAYHGVVHPYVVAFEDGTSTFAAGVKPAPVAPEKPWALTETVVLRAAKSVEAKGTRVRLVQPYDGFAKGTEGVVKATNYGLLVVVTDAEKRIEAYAYRFEVIEERKVGIVPISGKFKVGDLARVIEGQATATCKTGDIIEVTGLYGSYLYGTNKRTGLTVDLYSKRFERVARFEDTVLPKIALGVEVEVVVSVGSFARGQVVAATHVSASGDIKAKPKTPGSHEWLYGGEYAVRRILKSEVPVVKPAKGAVEVPSYVGDIEALDALPKGSIIVPLSPSEKHSAFVAKGGGKFANAAEGYDVTSWCRTYGITGKKTTGETGKNQRGFVLVHYPA